eukprot:6490124-Amphidinium_carterae.1
MARRPLQATFRKRHVCSLSPTLSPAREHFRVGASRTTRIQSQLPERDDAINPKSCAQQWGESNMTAT